MTSAQDSLIARDAKPLSPDPALDRRSGEVTAAKGVTRSKTEPDEGADLCGRSLLSRPSAPQYRRSLFRR
jgi:hypothetical protein